MTSIDINGRIFVKDQASIRTSAADGCTEISGFYRILKYGVLLLDKERIPFACIVNNRHRERFFVSAHRTPDGKTRYLYGLMLCTEKRLGLDTLSNSDQHDLARRLIQQLCPDTDSIG